MGGEWATTRLGDVAEINPDEIGRDWPHPHIRYIDISSVGEGQIESPPQWMKLSSAPSRAKRLIREGDTVLSTVRPNRRSMFFASKPGDDWVVSTGFAVLRPNIQLVDARFLYTCVFDNGFTEYLITREKGAAYPAVSPEDIANAEIPFPPLKEQQAIACILGALDDKIKLNRRMNRTLEATARAIFQSWFLDFDPVRAKAAGQQPLGLKPEIADLFPDSFDDSELGEIPKGWRIGKIDDAAYINTWTLGRGDALEAIDYVEISEVMRGEVGKVNRYIRGEEPSRARRRLKHGDTVLSTVRPDRGSHFLVLNPPESLIASTGFAVLTPKDGKWAFLHSATTRPEFGQELGRLADGGAYPAIRPEVVSGRDLVLPNDLKLVAAFDKIVQPLFLRAEVSRNECRSLSAIRDTLLLKLISGELPVPDAERIAGRCA